MRRHRLTARLSVLVATALGATVLVATMDPGAATALATGHSGTGRPALAMSGGGRLYVAWAGTTGTAAAKELDLGWSLDKGKTITKVAWTERVPQGTGAALNSDGTGVYIAWPAGNNGNTITAEYYDGSVLSCRTVLTGAVTAQAPAMATDPTTGIRYLGWTDTTGHITIGQLGSGTCATTHMMTLTNKVTLADTTLTGPALVYDSSGSSNLGVVLAWTGTEALNPVHVASYSGTAMLTKRTVVPSTVGTAGAVGLGVADSDLYLGFIGTDGNVYNAYSEGCLVTCFNPYTTGHHGISSYGIDTTMNSVYKGYFDTAGHLNIDPLVG